MTQWEEEQKSSGQIYKVKGRKTCFQLSWFMGKYRNESWNGEIN